MAALRKGLEPFVKGENPTESWLEDRVLEVMRAQGVPEPGRQFTLELPNGKTVRFDFVFREFVHLVEADGRLWHTSPSQRRADRAKDEGAGVVGWTVERVTYLDLLDRPGELFKRVR